MNHLSPRLARRVLRPAMTWLVAGVLLASCAAPIPGQAAAGNQASANTEVATDNVRSMPAEPDEGVIFAQMTNARPLDLSESGGRVGFVWGGEAFGAISSRYIPVDRDLDKSHTAQWYAAEAPDRIVYGCDRTTPASLYTYAWGAYSPLDINNPDVRRYMLETYVIPALQSGHKVIALDNVSLRNTGKRCGVYRGGQWVQLYSGESIDPAFSSAMLDWVGWLSREIHARGGYLALNAKVEPDDPELTRRLIALGDFWLEEASNTVDCKGRVSDNLWRTKFELAQWAAQLIGWVDLEKTCATPSQLDPDEAQWTVGNYLLARGPRSYLGLAHDGDRGRLNVRLPRGLNPPLGAAEGPAFELPGGWARRFRNGMVLVNPYSTSVFVYSLPDGDWTQWDGTPQQLRIVVPPTSARILLRRGG